MMKRGTSLMWLQYLKQIQTRLLANSSDARLLLIWPFYSYTVYLWLTGKIFWAVFLDTYHPVILYYRCYYSCLPDLNSLLHVSDNIYTIWNLAFLWPFHINQIPDLCWVTIIIINLIRACPIDKADKHLAGQYSIGLGSLRHWT